MFFRHICTFCALITSSGIYGPIYRERYGAFWGCWQSGGCDVASVAVAYGSDWLRSDIGRPFTGGSSMRRRSSTGPARYRLPMRKTHCGRKPTMLIRSSVRKSRSGLRSCRCMWGWKTCLTSRNRTRSLPHPIRGETISMQPWFGDLCMGGKSTVVCGGTYNHVLTI